MEKRDLHIAIDLDGTVLDWYRFTNKWIENNTEYRIVEPNEYDIKLRFNISKEQQDEFNDKMYEEYRTENPVYEGAVKTIKALEEAGIRLTFATSRDPRESSNDREFLVKNGLAGIPIRYCDPKANKILDIALLHATHLLEDNKDVAMANAVCGVKVILIDCPYNRTAEHDNITRVSGWDDIYKIFLN